MLKNLTKRQKEILDFIYQYSDEYGYSPTMREIQDKFHLKSVGTVHEHVENLKSKGYLDSEENEARSLSLTQKIQAKIAEAAYTVPLAGLITAGEPIEAVEDESETIEIPPSMNEPGEDVYALRVKGDSMIEEGIFNGDVVVIQPRHNARNGEIVVAIVNDNEATLKKFYKEKSRVRLQPANSKLKPMFFKDVQVRGVVKGLIRQF